MRVSISLEKTLCFLLALGTCFVIELGGLRAGNYLIQQFIIIVPSLFLMINYMLLKKQKINISIIAIIGACISIFLFASFKWGIDIGDIASLFGFIIIPIMIIVFNNANKKDEFLYYYIVLFSMLEVFAILLLLKEGAILDIRKVVKLQQVFYIWPNYFAMMSVIKFGFILILEKYRTRVKYRRILDMLSITTIFLSLSRTGIFMVITVLIIVNYLNYKDNKKRIRWYRKFGFIVMLVILIVITANVMEAKNLSAGATTERTMEARIWRWKDTLNTAKENIIIGTGFRSTVKTIGDIGSTHNDYIDILLKSGIIGFIIIYSYYLYRIKILFINREYEVIGLLLAIFLGSLVQNPLKNISIIIPFSALMSYSYKNKTALIKK